MATVLSDPKQALAQLACEAKERASKPLNWTIPTVPGSSCYLWAQAYLQKALHHRAKGEELVALYCERMAKCLGYASSLVPTLPEQVKDLVEYQITVAAHCVAASLLQAGLTQERITEVIDNLKDQMTQAALVMRAVCRIEERIGLDKLDDYDVTLE